jgi:hypothetical protein
MAPTLAVTVATVGLGELFGSVNEYQFEPGSKCNDIHLTLGGRQVTLCDPI